jgi:hypothetical protein
LPLRFHDINTQCPRPVDTVVPARFTFAACPPRLARNARTATEFFDLPTNRVVEMGMQLDL